MVRIWVLCLALSVCGLAQVTDGITASASRSITLPPENAVFTVDLTTDPGTTVEQAAALLKDTGITAANLVRVNGALPSGGPLVMRVGYEFQATAPYAKVKDMLGKLENARNTLAGRSTLDYSMSLTASEQAYQAARQRIMPELIAEVRQRAEFLANAGGLTLGLLESLSESGYPSATSVSFASFLLGLPSGGAISGLQATVSVTAKYGATKAWK